MKIPPWVTSEKVRCFNLHLENPGKMSCSEEATQSDVLLVLLRLLVLLPIEMKKEM